MHDAFGRELKVGDRVMVPMVIKTISLGADYCNVEVETVATMPPEHRYKTSLAAMNTLMLLRNRDGDSLDYKVDGEGPARIVPAVDRFGGVID